MKNEHFKNISLKSLFGFFITKMNNTNEKKQKLHYFKMMKNQYILNSPLVDFLITGWMALTKKCELRHFGTSEQHDIYTVDFLDQTHIVVLRCGIQRCYGYRCRCRCQSCKAWLQWLPTKTCIVHIRVGIKPPQLTPLRYLPTEFVV
jgi:hypothetical protein